MNQVHKLLEGGADDVNLSEIQDLINVLEEKKREYADKEKKLKDLKAEIDHLDTAVIPEKMGSLTEIRTKVQTPEGELIAQVKVKEILRANIKADDKTAAYNWIANSGFGDIIKSEVSVPFGRSEMEKAKRIHESLVAQGLPATLDQAIHWSTLDAFVREQLAKGMEFPPFIGIFEGKKIEVKYGK